MQAIGRDRRCTTSEASPRPTIATHRVASQAVTKPSNPRAQRARESERVRAAEDERRRDYQRQVRKQRMIGVGVVVCVVLAVVAVVAIATSQKDTKVATTSSTAPQATTSTTAVTGNPNPPVSLPAVPPGSAVAGTTACPPADGSAARTTEFAQAPPMCIDPNAEYTATIHTTKGDMIVALDPKAAPQSVNNFVTLARYHYYDGLPITKVVPRGWAEVADPTNADGSTGPGYTVAGETPKQGSIATPLIVAMIPDATGASGGAFIFGIGDQAAGMPPKATQVGTILDSRIDKGPNGDINKTVQQEIGKIGTKTGEVAELVTITGITVADGPLK